MSQLLQKPPVYESKESYGMQAWFQRVWQAVRYQPSFTVATLPSATIPAGLIYVSDEAGGATLAFSDGVDWRRVQDRAVVS